MIKLRHIPLSRPALPALFAMVAALSTVPSASAAPVVLPSGVKAPVTLTDGGANWIMDNGIVRATINKTSGNFRSLIYRGTETMAGGGAWEETPAEAAQVGGLSQAVTIDPTKNNGDRAEVAVKGITGGKVGLSPGSPGAPTTGTFNMDVEIRCAMGRGDSGIYTYAIFSHPAAYGPLTVPESRFITFINRSFDWLSVDADRNMLECAPTDWGTGVVVHAKEQRIMSKGVYKNSVEHKYSYNAIQYKIPAYGWSSTQQHVGIWFINPSIEYLSGGASKQELVCHFGDNANPTPIILDYWRGTHYGGGASCAMGLGEDWNKVIGPIFVYCNTLTDPKNPSQADLDTLKATEGNPTVPAAWKENATLLWQDALAQAGKEKAQWPYKWVNGVDYPHAEERGSVTGQIVLNDPQAATKKLPQLTVGLTHADYPRGTGAAAPATPAAGTPPARGRGGLGGGLIDWAHDAKFYQFWNDGTDDGKFTITNARPGKYTLHAFADGVLGELAQADVTITAGKTLDLGKIDWKPLRLGKQIWEIGYPNRNSSEFLKGDGDNYWLWGWPLRYPLLFPNDLTYTIGKSDYHKDWFFEQVPHGLSDAWLNPDAKDPANQRFGWVKAESLETYPQTDQTGPWRTYGRGRATTWTIKFDMDHAPKGQAALRIALSGADGTGGLAVTVNGKEAGVIRPVATNALRYNTDKGIWNEYTQRFDATLMKQGENQIQLTVPAGEVTSGVVYDYLRLELDENSTP
ncbi:MAG TPA: polysaccharide lyase family 4 protein [Phycisphaerae bacterium]|jgi:rhamnogalacturonan endolyase